MRRYQNGAPFNPALMAGREYPVDIHNGFPIISLQGKNVRSKKWEDWI